MRLAVVSQLNSPGGGSRFLRCLCSALVVNPEVERLGLFVDADALSRDAILDVLPAGFGAEVIPLGRDGGPASVAVPARSSMAGRLRAWGRQRPRLVGAYVGMKRGLLGMTPLVGLPQTKLSPRVIELLRGYDVVYFAWPRQIVLPDVRPAALAATFHDFNMRHGFGNYSPEQAAALETEMVEWLTGDVHPITSTRFIARELEEYYPQRRRSPEVVYLSSFALHEPDESEMRAVCDAYGLPSEFMLCPTNVGPHKNVARLLRGLGILRRSGRQEPLVLTGSGTHCIGRDYRGDPLHESIFRPFIDEINAVAREEQLTVGRDLWPLGYVPDSHMDALTKAAEVVVAPSLYEAGSGPALDAWKLGTRVVSSALTPVVEQMRFLGTEAELFDPMDVDDIARALAQGLEAPDVMLRRAERSAQAMRRYCWDDVAVGYLRVFREAVAARSEERTLPHE